MSFVINNRIRRNKKTPQFIESEWRREQKSRKIAGKFPLLKTSVRLRKKRGGERESISLSLSLSLSLSKFCRFQAPGCTQKRSRVKCRQQCSSPLPPPLLSLPWPESPLPQRCTEGPLSVATYFHNILPHGSIDILSVLQKMSYAADDLLSRALEDGLVLVQL